MVLSCTSSDVILFLASRVALVQSPDVLNPGLVIRKPAVGLWAAVAEAAGTPARPVSRVTSDAATSFSPQFPPPQRRWLFAGSQRARPLLGARGWGGVGSPTSCRALFLSGCSPFSSTCDWD